MVNLVLGDIVFKRLSKLDSGGLNELVGVGGRIGVLSSNIIVSRENFPKNRCGNCVCRWSAGWVAVL